MEANILYNGKCINEKKHDTSIFLHEDNIITIIHLVEYQNSVFKRRIEFKKRTNDKNRYITYSYHVAPNIVFSGELVISEEDIITGNISYQILKPNSTSITEGYYLTIKYSSYHIEHILTYQIQRNRIDEKILSPLSTSIIESFLFNILNGINNLHSIKNKPLFPPTPSITAIFKEEQNILGLIKDLIKEYPELEDFLYHYRPVFKRKRTL